MHQIALIAALQVASLFGSPQPGPVWINSLVDLPAGTLVLNAAICRVEGDFSYTDLDGRYVLAIDRIKCRDTLFTNGFEFAP